MNRTTSQQVCEAITAVRDGRDGGVDTLFSVLYDELRGLARRALKRESPSHVLQTTAVVHEAYLRLARSENLTWRDRAHFLAVAAGAIRRVLVDHARRLKAAKRGNRPNRVSLEEGLALGAAGLGDPDEIDLVALDDVLSRLFELHERQARIVELRFFGGLSEVEVAHVLSVSRRTVQADWAMAKSWLHAQLHPEETR